MDESKHLEYTELTPDQQVQADALFSYKRWPMERYTYDVDGAGNVAGWRYFKPSPACLKLIEFVMTGK
jgi:hypothetical protein